MLYGSSMFGTALLRALGNPKRGQTLMRRVQIVMFVTIPEVALTFAHNLFL